jgi:hypothetical protein
LGDLTVSLRLLGAPEIAQKSAELRLGVEGRERLSRRVPDHLKGVPASRSVE